MARAVSPAAWRTGTAHRPVGDWGVCTAAGWPGIIRWCGSTRPVSQAAWARESSSETAAVIWSGSRSGRVRSGVWPVGQVRMWTVVVEAVPGRGEPSGRRAQACTTCVSQPGGVQVASLGCRAMTAAASRPPARSRVSTCRSPKAWWPVSRGAGRRGATVAKARAHWSAARARSRHGLRAVREAVAWAARAPAVRAQPAGSSPAREGCHQFDPVQACTAAPAAAPAAPARAATARHGPVRSVRVRAGRGWAGREPVWAVQAMPVSRARMHTGPVHHHDARLMRIWSGSMVRAPSDRTAAVAAAAPAAAHQDRRPASIQARLGRPIRGPAARAQDARRARAACVGVAGPGSPSGPFGPVSATGRVHRATARAPAQRGAAKGRWACRQAAVAARAARPISGPGRTAAGRVRRATASPRGRAGAPAPG